MCGIKLIFSQGFSTPLFQTYFGALRGVDGQGREEYGIRRIEVDASRRVSAISMKVSGWFFLGLRLIDERGDFIVDETWLPESEQNWQVVDAEWVTKMLPEGEAIIGVKCVASKMKDNFPRIGF